MRLNNSYDLNAPTPFHTDVQTAESHTPLGRRENDAKVNDAIGTPLVFIFSIQSASSNFNALICERTTADCNIVISHRIK